MNSDRTSGVESLREERDAYREALDGANEKLERVNREVERLREALRYEHSHTLCDGTKHRASLVLDEEDQNG